MAEAKDDSVGNALLLGNGLEEGNAEELDEVLKLELGLPVTLEEDKEEGLVIALAEDEAVPEEVAVDDDVPEEVAEAKDDSVGNALLLGNALEEGNEGNAEELDEVLKLELGLPVTLEEDKEEGLVLALAEDEAVGDAVGGALIIL